MGPGWTNGASRLWVSPVPRKRPRKVRTAWCKEASQGESMTRAKETPWESSGRPMSASGLAGGQPRQGAEALLRAN